MDGIVDKLRHTATAELTNQKNRAIDGLGGIIANAVQESTQQLRDQQHDVIARFVDQAADQIAQLSQGLRERDVAELFNDLERFSRRQPELFVAGAFAAGFVAARFLKSGQRDARSGWGQNAGPRLADDGTSGEHRGYATAAGRTYPEPPAASTVHDYSSSRSALGGSSVNAEPTADAADADANAPETGSRKSRSRRTTTQTERP
jgi:hypothetical protein